MAVHHNARQTGAAPRRRHIGAARRLLRVLILSLPPAWAGSPAAGQEAEGALRLTVLSYNIQHGRGMDGEVDLERIAAVIRHTGADAVSLQEVDRHTRRTDRVDLPAELARLTGMDGVFEQNLALYRPAARWQGARVPRHRRAAGLRPSSHPGCARTPAGRRALES